MTKQITQEHHQVFVYGTLKKGFPNHDRFLGHTKMLGQAQLEGIMFHLGNFPAINLGERYTKILGEVYQVSWDDILHMDGLEGHPNFYQRVEVAIYPYRKAWTYILPHESASNERYIIPSGYWRGPESPKVQWGGWGQGAIVGAFMTDRERSTILVGTSSSNLREFALRRDYAKEEYNLSRISTGEVLGVYKNLGDLLKNHPQRNILSLPSRSDGKVAEEVKRQVLNQAGGTNYNPPTRQQILDSTPVVVKDVVAKEVFKEPQAVRLLGVKVKEA